MDRKPLPGGDLNPLALNPGYKTESLKEILKVTAPWTPLPEILQNCSRVEP